MKKRQRVPVFGSNPVPTSDASSQKRPRAPQHSHSADEEVSTSNVFGSDSESDSATPKEPPTFHARRQVGTCTPAVASELNSNHDGISTPASRLRVDTAAAIVDAKSVSSPPFHSPQYSLPHSAPVSVFGPGTDSDDGPARSHRSPLPLKERAVPMSTAVINAASDSDSDRGSAPHQRIETNRISKSTAEEDSLDIFMNALSSAPVRPLFRAPPASPSSDGNNAVIFTDLPLPSDEPSSSGVDSLSAEASARAADAERRSLVLPPVDHAAVSYPSIRKSLYNPLARNSQLSSDELTERLKTACVSISGTGARICPIASFTDLALALPQPLLAQVLSLFDAPTPIQCAVLPAALSGRDILATADTGSGKTLAYLVPLLTHARVQPSTRSVSSARGPRVLILAPTRELAAQIAREARRFGTPLGHTVTLITGGTGKFEQFRTLRDSGARILVATPGRLIDLLKMRACSMRFVSALALDEVDRMLDLGFGGQVATILGQIRPDAQRLFLSATLPGKVRRLAETHLNNPLRIIAVGASSGIAATQAMVCVDVLERYITLPVERARWNWLRGQLPHLVRGGLVIVFCRTRGGCAALANRVRGEGVAVACVHGETEQADRTGLLRLFKEGEVRVLVTTDLSARGLDIAEVRSVVNYEAAKDWEWHVHRVGRTGRADRSGDAYTLLCKDNTADCSFAEKAIAAFARAKIDPPKDLVDFIRAARRSR